MPLIAFVDETVLKELESDNSGNNEILFPEHEFLLSCFRINIHIEDLKKLTYVDILKMMLPLLKKSNSKEEERKATQNDINIFLKG